MALYELIKKSQKGDKIAFTELIMSLEDNLYKIAKTRLKDENDIDDAIQETMIKAYKSIKKLKQIRYFKTWVIKILINNCNDIFKSKKHSHIEEAEIEKLETEDSSIELDNNMDFNILINCLNYDERIAMTLHYVESYSNREIAKILKTNENTIKARIQRGRNKIKSSWKGEDKTWKN